MNQQVITICAWCTPKAELERLHREHKNISDGMCQSCKDKWDRDLKAKRGAK